MFMPPCAGAACVDPARAYVRVRISADEAQFTSTWTNRRLHQMTKMFYFKPHAVLFVSAGVLAFICRCARTNEREGGEKKKRKTKLHLRRQSKLRWLSCVSYNVVITSIRIPPPCCENESLIWQRFPSTPLAFCSPQLRNEPLYHNAMWDVNIVSIKV